MQCTSYLPQYNYSREQNANASGSLWQRCNCCFFCRSGRDCRILSQPPINDQYLAYNRELRQTMLTHEALFLYQVRELHRLYGRQRELMDEMRMMELSKDHPRMHTSSPNSFVSGVLCDTSQKALQIPSWLLSNPRDDKPSAHVVDNFQRPSNFVSKKSIQSGSEAYLAECHSKELEMPLCGSDKYGKRMLNLELPPEEYMDTDASEELEKKISSGVSPIWHDPSIRFVESSPMSNVMLKREASSSFSSCRKTSCLFDLNEPLPSDEPVSTISTSLVHSCTSSTEIMQQNQDVSEKPKSETPELREVAPDKLEGKGSSPVATKANPELQVQSAEKLSLPCNENPILGSKSAKRDHDFDLDERSMLSSSVTASSQLVQLSDQTYTGTSTSISYQKTSYMEVPIVIQALPCFSATCSSKKISRSSGRSSVIKGKYSNGNPTLSSNVGCITSHMSCSSTNQPSAESDASCVEDLVHNFPLMDMDLNITPSSSASDVEDFQEKDRSVDGEQKCENSIGPFIGPRIKPGSDGKTARCPEVLDPPISRSLFSASTAMDSNSNILGENHIQNGGKADLSAIHVSCDYSYKSEKSPTVDETTASSSASKVEDFQDKDRSVHGERRCENSVGRVSGSRFSASTIMVVDSDISGEKEIQNGGKADPSAVHVCRDSSHKSEKSATVDETCPANSCGKDTSQSNPCIDLQFSGIDQKQSQVLTETIAVVTDLQAPLSPDNKEHSPPREESEDNQSEKLEEATKELDRIAAEAILSIMLSGKQQCLKTSMSQPLEVPIACLDWFAGIACSVEDAAENESKNLLMDTPVVNCSGLAPKPLKHSEIMTTKSAGINIDDHFHMIIDQQNKLSGGGSLLTAQGQSRKMRGWKEVQSQDLPCASSLCSYDMAENLRPIKKLRTAARTSREAIKVEKKVRRVSSARGRRQSKKFPLNAISRRVCSLPKQNTCQNEQSFLQSCSFGWGKKHRRQKHRRARTEFDLGFT